MHTCNTPYIHTYLICIRFGKYVYAGDCVAAYKMPENNTRAEHEDDLHFDYAPFLWAIQKRAHKYLAAGRCPALPPCQATNSHASSAHFLHGRKWREDFGRKIV